MKEAARIRLHCKSPTLGMIPTFDQMLLPLLAIASKKANGRSEK